MSKKKKQKPEITDSDIQWRDKIEKMREYSQDQFDKLIVYLSSGGLIFTVGFVKDIVKISEATNKALLKTSWAAFALSLIFILLSHQSALASTNAELKEKEKRSNNWDKFTSFLNVSSFILLLSGIILFVIFTIKNI